MCNRPHVHRVMDGFDPWLAELGYVREGNCYRVREENPDNVILVSHGGASSVVLSRLFNLPFPYVCKAIQPTLTAVSIIHFKGEVGSLIVPMMELLNDGKHTEGINVQNYYGK